MPPLPDEVRNPTRLDLARWLVDPANPLTPRVTMNRFWQRYFGQGLVETENDFGTQGTPPTHPELLDWLASEFVGNAECGVRSAELKTDEPTNHSAFRTPNSALSWSMKRMHRLIVTSATYRQSSRARSDLERTDPRNKLLARQSRPRLEAETIRDAALAASGLLSEKIGGPSVFPPQPAGIYRFTQQDKKWTDSKGDDRYRRGMYTYFWRSSPDPFLMTFDAPGGNVTCTRRVHANTPLQALTLANDRAFFEIAQGLGSRVLREGPSDDAGRVALAFRLCLTREPTSAEQERLIEFLQAQRRAFAGNEKAAAEVAGKGWPESVDVAQAAAWTSVARVLLNLDEFVTRE
jgi:hypothetical protein